MYYDDGDPYISANRGVDWSSGRSNSEVSSERNTINMILHGMASCITFALFILSAIMLIADSDSLKILILLAGILILIVPVLSIASFVITICDIIDIHKKGYKIVGLILSLILYMPAYFLCRACALGKPKSKGVVYLICVTMMLLISILGYVGIVLYMLLSTGAL